MDNIKFADLGMAALVRNYGLITWLKDGYPYLTGGTTTCGTGADDHQHPHSQAGINYPAPILPVLKDTRTLTMW